MGQNAISYIGPKLWNKLPIDIKLIKTRNGFKHKIKSTYFETLQKCNVHTVTLTSHCFLPSHLPTLCPVISTLLGSIMETRHIALLLSPCHIYRGGFRLRGVDAFILLFASHFVCFCLNVVYFSFYLWRIKLTYLLTYLLTNPQNVAIPAASLGPYSFRPLLTVERSN